jgi:hypothetical protein
MTSVPPVGGNGTTIRTGLTGYACACTAPAATHATAATSAACARHAGLLIYAGPQAIAYPDG